ncbi:MAG: hypothetical protein NVSMB18_18080 [Acetobacteraceae bacterium]
MDHDAELLGALEPRQFSAVQQQKLPRRALGRFTRALLVLLRLYIIVAVPVVVYAFVRALDTPH